jgi:predicted RNase H-like HicB family nuclease
MERGARPEVTHYTYRVTWSAEDQEFVASCAEFPSLSWLAASQVEALQGLEDLLRQVITDLEEQGEPVPQPYADRHYSGKFDLLAH